jgi:hypothetical protein
MEQGVEDYPRTLAEFEGRFSSEEACREYLFRLRWPGGFPYSRCGDSKAWLNHTPSSPVTIQSRLRPE